MPSCVGCHLDLPVDARFCPRCGTPQKKATADPLVNQKLDDRYLLLELVGEGGSGKVYMARHVALGKRVAVKILHRQLVHDTQASERFRKEAQAVANLENPHILQVFDYGHTTDGSPYIVMELLQGETLASRLNRQKKLSLAELLPILRQVADGLGEAHALGYIHRDLRPRNLMLVERDGRPDFVKILDFGLAKIIHPGLDPSVSGVGFIFGDPTYSAPETMKAGTVDGRVDIYSLGVIVYQALSGHPPFTGDTVFDVMSKHLDAPVPPLEGSAVAVVRGIDAVLQKALAKNPDQRYRTVLQFYEALAALQDQPVVPSAHAVKHPVFIGTNSYLNLQPPIRNAQTPVLARVPGGGVLQVTPELPASLPSQEKQIPENAAVQKGAEPQLPDAGEEGGVAGDGIPLGAPSQSFMEREEMRVQQRLQEAARARRMWMLVAAAAAGLLAVVWGIHHYASSSSSDMDAAPLPVESPSEPVIPAQPEPAMPSEPAIPAQPEPAMPVEPELAMPAQPEPAMPVEPELAMPAQPEPAMKVYENMDVSPVRSEKPKPGDGMNPVPVEVPMEIPMATVAEDALKTARELYASGQAARAFEMAMAAARANPSNAAAWQLAGECAFETGQWQAAETAYARLVQLTPSAKNLYRLGSAQLKQGKTGEARRNFEKSLEIDPQFGPAKSALEKLQ